MLLIVITALMVSFTMLSLVARALLYVSATIVDKIRLLFFSLRLVFFVYVRIVFGFHGINNVILAISVILCHLGTLLKWIPEQPLSANTADTSHFHLNRACGRRSRVIGEIWGCLFVYTFRDPAVPVADLGLPGMAV